MKQVDKLLGRPSAPAAAELSRRTARSAKPNTGNKILIVEDNADNRLAVGAILHELGYEYLIAEDGRQAVKMAKQFYPSLVLMDIELPEFSGLEAGKQIKADPVLGDVPMVAVTALAMKGDREEILSAGFDDYVSKPIDPTVLESTIRKWLD